MRKYKYILFDADNTLFDFSACEKNAISNVFSRYNISLSNTCLFSHFNDLVWKELEIGKISRAELRVKRFKLLLEEINRTELDASVLDNEYFEEMSKQSIAFCESEEILKKCTELGYIICVITNGSKYVQTKRFENSPLKPYISSLYISEDIGADKPSTSFFSYVLNDLNAKQEECLIVGDSLTSDIAGGNGIGIDTTWFNPERKSNTTSYNPTYTINTLKEIIGIIGESDDRERCI